jgi:hypothetical protein
VSTPARCRTRPEARRREPPCRDGLPGRAGRSPPGSRADGRLPAVSSPASGAPDRTRTCNCCLGDVSAQTLCRSANLLLAGHRRAKLSSVGAAVLTRLAPPVCRHQIDFQRRHDSDRGAGRLRVLRAVVIEFACPFILRRPDPADWATPAWRLWWDLFSVCLPVSRSHNLGAPGRPWSAPGRWRGALPRHPTELLEPVDWPADPKVASLAPTGQSHHGGQIKCAIETREL